MFTRVSRKLVSPTSGLVAGEGTAFPLPAAWGADLGKQPKGCSQPHISLATQLPTSLTTSSHADAQPPPTPLPFPRLPKWIHHFKVHLELATQSHPVRC